MFLLGRRQAELAETVQARTRDLQEELAARKRAQEELRQNLSLLRAVTEGSSDAIFVKDRKGCYQMINTAGARFVGRTPESILGQKDEDLVDAESARVFTASDQQVMASGEVQTFEERAHLKGRLIIYHAIKSPWRDEQGNIIGVVGISRDITARIQALEALEASEREQRRLAQQLENERARLVAAQAVAKVGSWETDLVTGTVIWSQETYRIFGTDPDHFLPTHQGFLELVHPEDREKVEQAFINSLSQPIPCVIEHRIVLPTGEVKAVEERWQVFQDETGKPFRAIGTCQDVSEHKRFEKQLRALSARLQSLREEERIRISREIHDELGQQLTALKMDLYWLEGRLEQISDAKLRAALEDKIMGASTAADETMATVQRIAAELRPAMLDNLGLISTLRHEAKQFETRVGIPVQLQLPPGPVRLSNEIATTAYRIFQEVLTNVARHAQASQVQATLEVDDRRLRLLVSDNGVGVSPQNLANPKSLGLLGMTERAAMLNGRVRITGSPGDGTSVELEIPIANSAANDKQS